LNLLRRLGGLGLLALAALEIIVRSACYVGRSKIDFPRQSETLDLTTLTDPLH